jgi:hypothetical protein
MVVWVIAGTITVKSVQATGIAGIMNLNKRLSRHLRCPTVVLLGHRAARETLVNSTATGTAVACARVCAQVGNTVLQPFND